MGWKGSGGRWIVELTLPVLTLSFSFFSAMRRGDAGAIGVRKYVHNLVERVICLLG